MTDDTPALDELEAELVKVRASVDRVRSIAQNWSEGPCLTGYRLADPDDNDSECLHCAAQTIRMALDGPARGPQVLVDLPTDAIKIQRGGIRYPAMGPEDIPDTKSNDREEPTIPDLAELLRDWRLTPCEHASPPGISPACCAPCLRDRILASEWLRRDRARERAEALEEYARSLKFGMQPGSSSWAVADVALMQAARIRSDAGIGGGGDGAEPRVIATPGGGELTEQSDGTWRITKPDERAWTPGEAR